jgi:hypothetical protein
MPRSLNTGVLRLSSLHCVGILRALLDEEGLLSALHTVVYFPPNIPPPVGVAADSWFDWKE